jgi:hypothetical protein
MQNVSFRSDSILIIINCAITYLWKWDLAIIYTLQHCLVHFCMVCATSFNLISNDPSCHVGYNIWGHGVLLWPLSPGGRKPASASSVTHLSPRPPRCALSRFCFHWQNIVGFIIINVGLFLVYYSI